MINFVKILYFTIFGIGLPLFFMGIGMMMVDKVYNLNLAKSDKKELKRMYSIYIGIGVGLPVFMLLIGFIKLML